MPRKTKLPKGEKEPIEKIVDEWDIPDVSYGGDPTAPKKRHPKVPIEVPNEDSLPPEEVERIKHNIRMKRYRDKKSGKVTPETLTKREIKKLETNELIDMTEYTRDALLHVLERKIKLMMLSDTSLEKASLNQIVSAYGTMFDKAQLLNGLATSNVSVRAKVDVNMNADEVLAELNKMREKNG